MEQQRRMDEAGSVDLTNSGKQVESQEKEITAADNRNDLLFYSKRCVTWSNVNWRLSGEDKGRACLWQGPIRTNIP